MATAKADSVSVNFESPTYVVGNINGQDGWIKTGPYDVSVATNSYGFITFGSQTLKMSDTITSGSFGDQTFSKPLGDEAGETDAFNNGYSGGIRQPHFEAQFDIASTNPTVQPGMHMSVSPDRGDGARMSYLRFEDDTNGINVYFDDVQGTTNPANFVETQVGTNLSRSVPHTIKFYMNFIDGPSNDVVKIYIDGILVHTGTSWENYFRFDSESNPGLLQNNSRTVDSLLFRESGAASLGNVGGFLVDNVSLLSGPIPSTNQKVNICHKEGKKGAFHLINVSTDAKQAHLNHGDGLPGVNFTEDCSQRLLIGSWHLSVNSGAYLHDMVIDSVLSDGSITGHGGYPAGSLVYPWPYNWTLTGQLMGSNISLTLLYQNGYTATITGTVNGTWDGMIGGAGTGGVTNWTASR